MMEVGKTFYDNFGNGLVTNEVLNIEAQIDEHETTSKKPKIIDVWVTLKTVRRFFVCNTEAEDKLF